MAKKTSGKRKQKPKIIEFSNRFSHYDIEECISVYFEGNLERFLRKHRKQYYYELTYSRTFRKWRKKKKTNKALNIILRRCHKLPGEVNKVCNILITLNKYYSWEINSSNADISCDIHFMLSNDIREYNQKRTSRNREIIDKIKINKRQAIREQKARGFINIDDFDEFDKSFSHILSIADRKLIYPKNILSIPMTLKQRVKAQKIETGENIIFNTVYKGLSSIGVRGYTRVNNPI